VRTILRAAAALAVFLASASAFANGRYPASNELVFSPTSGNVVVLRTTFGILISHDGGSTWTWLCEDALGLSPAASEDPTLGLTANDTLIAGLYSGLQVSPDTGCAWSSVPGLVEQQVVDVAVRSASPRSAVALVSTYSATAVPDSSVGYSTQLYETTDDGATWSALGGPFDATVAVTTVDVAASDPNRLYITGFRSSALFTPALFVSVDHGMSWSEHAMPPLSHDVGLYIAGVDPQRADLVYLRTQGAPSATGRSRLFVTRDQGQSFQTALSLPGSMLGFALSPDGSKVYAGIEKGGLFVANRDELLAAADGGALPSVGDAGGTASPAFRQTSGIHVQCLATHGSELWACSDEASGFIAGASLDDGASFTPKLHIHGIAGPIACGADAAAAQCSGARWQQVCQTLMGCAGDAGIDGGAGDAAGDAASEDAGSNAPPHGPSSCGCSVAGRRNAFGLRATIVALATAAAVRRRRRNQTIH
jgi:photosystem II stability/assembly factor-like uncharacterized protein